MMESPSEGSAAAAARSVSCGNEARIVEQQIDASAPNAADFVAIEIQSEQPQQATAQRDEHNKGASLERIDAAAVATTVQAAENESLAEEDGKVCRVCHLTLPPARSSDTGSLEPDSKSMEAIELGCSCKDDLSVAHKRCAQTWFKIKGNRICEICGQQAHNVPAVAGGAGSDDYSCGRRSDELTGGEARGVANSDPRSFWHHRPICNFVLAFVVVILLLPWLFRIRLF